MPWMALDCSHTAESLLALWLACINVTGCCRNFEQDTEWVELQSKATLLFAAASLTPTNLCRTKTMSRVAERPKLRELLRN